MYPILTSAWTLLSQNGITYQKHYWLLNRVILDRKIIQWTIVNESHICGHNDSERGPRSLHKNGRVVRIGLKVSMLSGEWKQPKLQTGLYVSRINYIVFITALISWVVICKSVLEDSSWLRVAPPAKIRPNQASRMLEIEVLVCSYHVASSVSVLHYR